MGRRRVRASGPGSAGLFERDGKHTSQEAKARREVKSVMACAHGAERFSSSATVEHRTDGADRSIRRQLFDMRVYANFAKAEASRRSQLRQLAEMGATAPRSSVAVGPLRAVWRRRHAAAVPLGNVPSLQSLCARKVAEDLEYFSAEEMEQIALLPADVRGDVLQWASLTSLRREARSGRRSGVLTDSALASLLDPSITALSVSCSLVTDACVDLIEPKLQLAAQDAGGDKEEEEEEEAEEEEEEWWSNDAHLEELRVTGLHRLLKLDMSFCSELTEAVIGRLGDAFPALQSLSLAGNFNVEENSLYVARALCHQGHFRFLRTLDVSCCSWVSFELFVQAGLLSPDTTVAMESLEELRAEHCADLARVVAHDDVFVLELEQAVECDQGEEEELLGVESAAAHLARLAHMAALDHQGTETRSPGTELGAGGGGTGGGTGGGRPDALELFSGVGLLLSGFHVCRVRERAADGGAQWVTVLRGVRAPKRRLLRIVTSSTAA